MVCGAAVDRHENDRQRQRAVFKFLDTTKDKRTEEESRSVSATTVDYSQDGEDEEQYDDDYYEEYEDGMSGDYEVELPKGTHVVHMCRVGFFVHILFFSCFNTSSCVFFLALSCYVKQTQRPVSHPGSCKNRSKEKEGKWEVERKRQGEEEESMPEEIQEFLHPRHLPVPAGPPFTILRVSTSSVSLLYPLSTWSVVILTSRRPPVFAGAIPVTLVTGVSFSCCPWRNLRAATTAPRLWPWWPWCCHPCVSSSSAFCYC